MKTHLHQAKIYLPVDIAKALNKKPELVQKAVEAFYVRDPAQLRVIFSHLDNHRKLILVGRFTDDSLLTFPFNP